jgi:hypothetical protein
VFAIQVSQGCLTSLITRWRLGVDITWSEYDCHPQKDSPKKESAGFYPQQPSAPHFTAAMVVTGLPGAIRLTAHKWQLILYTVCCAGTRWKIAPCNKLPQSR